MKTNSKNKKEKAPCGFVVWEGEANGQRIACVATLKSRNVKTGQMVQLWFLNKDTDPLVAAAAGLDQATVCQGCPLAGVGDARVCYVNLGQAPKRIYKALRAGRYPYLSPVDYPAVFGGKAVRFGAYGNPSLLPLELIERIAGHASAWTGYFHDWMQMGKEKALAYNRFFMASTETDFKLSVAKAWGLRVFHASEDKPEGMLECLNSTIGIKCADCRLCAGLSKPAKDIWINPHGQGAKKLKALSKGGPAE